jgi:hypothetical protein
VIAMVGTSTLPVSVAYTAIELERRRLRALFAGVYRHDGSIDEVALGRFRAALTGEQEG